MSRVLLFACAVLLALPMAAQQQDPSAPAAQQNSSAKHKKQDQQPPAEKKPSTAAQNPFPEAQSEAAAHQAQQQQDPNAAPPAPTPQEADAPKPKSSKTDKPSEADQNPFPENQSRKAAQQDQQQPPSSRSPGYSSSQSGLQGLDIPKTNEDVRNIHNPSLGNNDTQVGMFYLKTGNFKGAYDRFVEATQVDPANADAVFGLAESARHLNLRDEAIRNYKLYLSAVPDGSRAKDSRKALKELGVQPNS